MSSPVEVRVVLTGETGPLASGPAQPAGGGWSHRGTGGGGGPARPAGFDPTEAALRRMLREAERREAEDTYRGLRGLPSVEEEAGAKAEARARKDAERAQREADRTDPLKMAQARIDRETRARDAESHYRRLQGLPEDAQITQYKAGMKPPPVQLAGAGEAAAGEAEAGAGLAGIAGPALIAVGAVVAFGAAVAKVSEAVTARAQELAGYSPELAAAGARADLRGLQSDVKDAQQLGPSMAKVEDEWTRILADIRDLIRPIVKFLLELLGPFLEFARKILDWVKETFGIKGDDEDEDALKRLWDQFQALGDFGSPRRVRDPLADPLRRAADQRINAPVFAGF